MNTYIHTQKWAIHRLKMRLCYQSRTMIHFIPYTDGPKGKINNTGKGQHSEDLEALRFPLKSK